MSADDYSLFYCLTTSGWRIVEDEHARVEGWTRLYEVRVYQGSPYGRTSRHWTLIDENPDFKGDEAEDLERRFPRQEPSSELSPEALKYLKEELAKSISRRT